MPKSRSSRRCHGISGHRAAKSSTCCWQRKASNKRRRARSDHRRPDQLTRWCGCASSAIARPDPPIVAVSRSRLRTPSARIAAPRFSRALATSPVAVLSGITDLLRGRRAGVEASGDALRDAVAARLARSPSQPRSWPADLAVLSRLPPADVARLASAKGPAPGLAALLPWACAYLQKDAAGENHAALIF